MDEKQIRDQIAEIPEELLQEVAAGRGTPKTIRRPSPDGGGLGRC
jgi:hypothetical protein